MYYPPRPVQEVLPIYLAAVDDEAADRVAMPADVLGRRVDDDVRAMLQRTADDRRGGVVDDERNAQLFGDGRHFADRKDLQLRIGQRFGIVGASARVGGAEEIPRIARTTGSARWRERVWK